MQDIKISALCQVAIDNVCITAPTTPDPLKSCLKPRKIKVINVSTFILKFQACSVGWE